MFYLAINVAMKDINGVDALFCCFISFIILKVLKKYTEVSFLGELFL